MPCRHRNEKRRTAVRLFFDNSGRSDKRPTSDLRPPTSHQRSLAMREWRRWYGQRIGQVLWLQRFNPFTNSASVGKTRLLAF